MIKKTFNYKMFKILKPNRKINNSHVRKLMESISARDLSEFYPILINEKNEVIDGQHREKV